MNKFLAILLIVSPTLMVSCVNRRAGDPLLIPYAESILSDTTSAPYLVLKNSGSDGKNGTITVAGGEEAFYLGEQFLTCDMFDNVNGRNIRDSLPDFAGETVSVLYDECNAPYYDYILNNNAQFLKELNIRNFLSAIDTTVHTGPFDTGSLVRKPGAKIYVMASPYSSAFGYKDIQALVSASGCNIDVLSPVHAMLSYAKKRHGGENINLGVWTTTEIRSAGIYSDILSEQAGITYRIICPDRSSGTREKRILSFLEMYRDSLPDNVLDAVLVDDFPESADSLNMTLGRMRISQKDSLAKYISILSEGFEFIDTRTAIIHECIRYMRSVNCFTHRVAYPEALIYRTVPTSGLPADDYTDNGGLITSFKYNRAGNSDFSTFSTVEAKEMDLPDSVTAFIREYCPKLYEQYVSK